MTAPKVDTIRRHCDSHLAIEILADRKVITKEEATAFHDRVRRVDNAGYTRIYGPTSTTLSTRCQHCGEAIHEMTDPPFWLGVGEIGWATWDPDGRHREFHCPARALNVHGNGTEPHEAVAS